MDLQKLQEELRQKALQRAQAEKAAHGKGKYDTYDNIFSE